MKIGNALAASLLAFMMAFSWAPAPNAGPGQIAVPQPAYQIVRPRDAGASCNVLVAEIEQISTEVQLRSAARMNEARSLVANRRALHLATLLRQQGCGAQAVGA